jgi:hypothetical protein
MIIFLKELPGAVHLLELAVVYLIGCIWASGYNVGIATDVKLPEPPYAITRSL